MESGDGEDEQQRQTSKDSSGNISEKNFFIKIPSYQEVFGNAGAGGSTASSSNSSFSQAFSFIKASEFYTPPPSPPPPPPEQAPRDGTGPPEAPALAGPSPSSSHASTSSSSAPSSVQNRNAILVSHRQKGNPLLKHIRNVKWMFANVVCDYLLGQSSCALYLSLRYHLLHPDYLYYRIRELQKNFKLRIVVCHVDMEDVVKPLLEVTRTALLHDCTLLCCWSLEECGRYLETIKVYENKSANSIREQMDTDYLSRLTQALTTVRHVNKTDVVTLGSTFGSLSHIMDASMEDLARCPGIGERKVKRLHDTFHEPFRRVSSRPAGPPEVVPVDQKNDAGEEGSSSPLRTDGAEDGKVSTDSPEHGKEPGVTVKSALTAAFAKYPMDRVRKQKGKNRLVEQEGEGTDAAST